MVRTRSSYVNTPSRQLAYVASSLMRRKRKATKPFVRSKTARKMLFRNKGSRTRTKEIKEKDLLEISTHNDLSMHWLRGVTLKKHMTGKFGTGAKHQEDYQNILVAAQGKQGVGIGEILFSRGKLIGSTNPARNVTTQAALDYYALNPSSGNSGSGLFGSTAVVDNDNAMLGVKSAVYTIEFLSMQSVAQTVDLYFLMPKFDCSQNPYESWKDYLVAERLSSAAVTGNTTIGALNAQFGGVDANNWGQDPFKTRHFGRMWKCIRKASFVLQPGDQRNYKFRVTYNKVAKRGTFIYDRTAGDYMAGWTVVPMYVIRGGVVGLSETGTASAASEVGHAEVRTGTIETVNYDFKFPVSPNRYVKFNEMNLVVNQAATKEVQIDVEDDAVVMQTA